MLLTQTVNKKILESLVHETFTNFGKVSSSLLLDSLKLLGFYYATNAGISINLEDLKTPKVKQEFIHNANYEIDKISEEWKQGFVSDTERFQSIIDSWNFATESLKNRIVDYYQKFDPANNLYIMAFSGARGNMSQVRQLVGMRGLMSDQEGNIIDLPIQSNFREGLSSIDYIISSYGARKGIVDTALKTADSGYLTRRLIYVAQDLVIREFDCFTKNGLLIQLNPNTDTRNLIGRTLITASSVKNEKLIPFNNLILTPEILKDLKTKDPQILNIRSALTCLSHGSICQKCYGWDLAQGHLISLGEAVGIIAAQSIGEPGTQLTMRTFHTGGIFTGELLKQIKAPFSGKIIIPNSLKTISYRTNHGKIVLKLQQEATIKLIDWKGLKKEIFLDVGSFIYINKSSFIKKHEIIAECSTQSLIAGRRRLKPIYTSMDGEIRFENLMVRKRVRDKRTLKVTEDDGILWIAAGKIFIIPKESKYNLGSKLINNKAFASLKIITPFSGVVKIKDLNTFSIVNEDNTFECNLNDFLKSYKNCSVKFSSTVKNFQYVDKHTIIGFIEFFPKVEGSIYSIREKMSKYKKSLLIVTEDDTWKLNSDHYNKFSFFTNKKTLVRVGNSINTNSKFSNSGFFLKKDGFKMIFQKATPIFLSRGTLLNYKQGDFVVEKEVFATLVNVSHQTEDIVQGLPKIEELIEARKPKKKAFLAERPGILLNSSFTDPLCSLKLNKKEQEFLQCTSKTKQIEPFLRTNLEKKKSDKQFLTVGHSIYSKDEIVYFNNKIYNFYTIPSSFFTELKQSNKKETEYSISTLKQNSLLINHKISVSKWFLSKKGYKKLTLLKQKDGISIPWLILTKDFSVYENKIGDLIIETPSKQLFFLEYFNPVINYEIPLTSKVLINPGSFVDIGEPLTDGRIDIHDLLNILFKYHSVLDGTLKGTLRSLTKFQLLMVNSIQAIYQSQGVNVSSKHIEIIVKQMTSKVVILKSGDTPLIPGEVIDLSLIQEIYKTLQDTEVLNGYRLPEYKPLLTSSTKSSLNKDGFLSAAGFQETKKVLTAAAIEGSTDWLRGLKESIIVGRLIPAGSSFLNYKNYLDTIYLFKNKSIK